MQKFTKAELEVLKLVEEGYSNKEIAEKLFISLSTVKAYVSSNIKKSGARNRTNLAHIARKENLV